MASFICCAICPGNWICRSVSLRPVMSRMVSIAPMVDGRESILVLPPVVELERIAEIWDALVVGLISGDEGKTVLEGDGRDDGIS